MHIFTSSWSEYQGVGRVAICQGRPRGQPAGYKFYKPLAPSWDIIKTTNSISEYRPRYHAEILAALDPHQVLADIIKMAQGHPPVLMCFEVTPLHDNNFCHRTMAAVWLAKHTGITHSEMAEHVQPQMAL
jgi:hypothetical protein